MNFLAIDTSAKYLSAVAYADGRTQKLYLPDCALRHSVVLMDAIDEVCRNLQLRTDACDFFAVTVGPGSFTGIRIGISAVKGLCFAAGKPALAVTSFDTLAYAEERTGSVLALVDAGHGCFYACPYEGAGLLQAGTPSFLTRDEVVSLCEAGYLPVAAEDLGLECRLADPCEGLLAAVLAKAGETIPARQLEALYLRKSSAEEHRK